MKTARIAAWNAAVMQFALPLVSVFAQGILTPPGAPAPTMKSLDQIEARTAITNAASLVTISQPGSYYLTGNLTVSTGNGISINTNGVTLDLSGFTISSTAAGATGTGILLNGGFSDITICNGHIRGGVTNNGSGFYSGGGFANGIYSDYLPQNVLVSRISVSGCLNYGINLYYEYSTVVEACTVQTVGSYGIQATTVKSCSALDCGFYAIAGHAVSDCRGQCSGNIGSGVYATTAVNCYGVSSNGVGVSAETAQNCYGFSSGSYGLYSITAQNCYGNSSTGIGLYADTAQNCYGLTTGSDYGLYAYATASGCSGYSYYGTGLSAFIAHVCRGGTISGTALSTTHNVNSF